jgi:hypothetical protein
VTVGNVLGVSFRYRPGLWYIYRFVTPKVLTAAHGPRLVAESTRLGHEPWAAAPHLATARGAMPRIWPRAWRVEKSIEFEPKRPPQPSYEAIYATFALLVAPHSLTTRHATRENYDGLPPARNGPQRPATARGGRGSTRDTDLCPTGLLIDAVTFCHKYTIVEIGKR